MKMNITMLYREPHRVFAAADKGEVVLERMGIEYTLRRRRKTRQPLYGSLRGSILKDLGKPTVNWKASQ